MRPTLQSTQDIPLGSLKAAFAEPPWDGIVEVDDGQMCFRSITAPSWMTFVANLEWWQALLAGGLSVYATTLVSEAAKDTWKHKAAIGRALKRTGVSLAELAQKLVTLQDLSQPRTRLMIGIPMPNEFFPAIHQLNSRDPNEVEIQLARFCLHAASLQNMIDRGEIDPIGSPTMELHDDGDLTIKWMDKTALDVREVRLPAPDSEA